MIIVVVVVGEAFHFISFLLLLLSLFDRSSSARIDHSGYESIAGTIYSIRSNEKRGHPETEFRPKWPNTNGRHYEQWVGGKTTAASCTQTA